MIIELWMLPIFVFRGVIAAVIIYYWGRYVDSNPPKNTLLYRIWNADTKYRKLMIKYYWQIGVLIFLLQFPIMHFWPT